MDIATRLRAKLKLDSDESLVDMFDDILLAFNSRLQDSAYLEEQMLQMAIHFEKTRKSYVNLYAEFKQTEEENFNLERKVKQLESKYNQARAQMATEIEEKESLQRQLTEMENTLNLMKEIVFENSDNVNKLKLGDEQRSKLVRACSIKSSFRGKTPQKRRIAKVEETLDESKFDMSDMSFDETINNLSFKAAPFKTPFGRGKRSIDTLKMDESNLPMPAANSTVSDSSAGNSIDSINKKIKCEIESGNEMTTRVRGPAVLTVTEVKRRSGGGRINRATGHTARRRQSRHHRQSVLVEEDETEKEEDSFFTPVSTKTDTIKARKILGANESQISLEKADIKHRWVNKRCVTVETCRVCFKRIKFSKVCLKCSTCRVIVHPECESKLTLGCNEPNNNTNNAKKVTPGKQNLENFLLDKKASPKIPPQIYLTVHSVDERLNEEGVYRVSGSSKNVQDLKKSLLYGDFADVDFEAIDVHVLTSFIKDFFRDQINEPLLTYKLLSKFIENSETASHQSTLKSLIKKLPEVNRDTLSFFIVHLQNVVGGESKNRMNMKALARSVGPSVVGFPSPCPSLEQIKSASKYQEEIVLNLLSLPRSFYNNFISGSQNRSIRRTLSNVSERSNI